MPPAVPPPAADPPVIRLRRLAKHHGDVRAVDQLDLDIARGECFVLLGPSGCGKTTTLRLLAGLETPDPGGTIELLGRDCTLLRPYDRPLGMVFQHYALFPHLDVGQNVAFGLEERRVPAAEIRRRVAQALALVQLEAGTFARRRPHELSGGQRQRVALARALVLEPPILLLDEPLGALDLKLRQAMQLELKALTRSLGITTVVVTHDQQEALTLGDRLGVMQHGRLEQVGTPAEVYEAPRTRFVAGFIGEVNLLEGEAAGSGTRWTVRTAAGPVALVDDTGLARPGSIAIAIRPEWMVLADPAAPPDGLTGLAGTVRDLVYLGETLHAVVDVTGATLRVALRNEGQLQRPLPWQRGSAVLVAWRPEDAQVLAA